MRWTARGHEGGRLQACSGDAGVPPGQLQERLGTTRTWRLGGAGRERVRDRRLRPNWAWDGWVTVTTTKIYNHVELEIKIKTTFGVK